MSLHLKGVTEITPESAGWTYTGLRIVTLGDAVTVATQQDEYAIIPLAGSGEVEAEGRTLTLHGRESVFEAVSDFAYIPRDSEFRLDRNRSLRARPRARAAEARRRLRPGGAGPRRDPRRGELHPPAEQLPRPGRVPRRPARVRRGAHTRGELVELPPAQA